MATRNKVVHHGERSLYAAVPMGLARDGELSSAARSVALLIWSHDAKWDQSAADVAKMLGMHRSTVGAALSNLQERGWLVREILSLDAKGKPSRERWHIQLANVRFTDERIETLAGNLSKKPAGSSSAHLKTRQVPVGKLDRLPVGFLDTIEVDTEMHVVHFTDKEVQQNLSKKPAGSESVTGPPVGGNPQLAADSNQHVKPGTEQPEDGDPGQPDLTGPLTRPVSGWVEQDAQHVVDAPVDSHPRRPLGRDGQNSDSHRLSINIDNRGDDPEHIRAMFYVGTCKHCPEAVDLVDHHFYRKIREREWDVWHPECMEKDPWGAGDEYVPAISV
ncbi:helix-turn-helix domain-containing protein [Mycolicibacterium sp.]|uniref:helix-turn-helix domain-containing protein n=1 Tax=Mycolicibacterium sp. TaxID=2320850 RepID=UPI0037CA04E9